MSVPVRVVTPLSPAKVAEERKNAASAGANGRGRKRKVSGRKGKSSRGEEGDVVEEAVGAGQGEVVGGAGVVAAAVAPVRQQQVQQRAQLQQARQQVRQQAQLQVQQQAQQLAQQRLQQQQSEQQQQVQQQQQQHKQQQQQEQMSRHRQQQQRQFQLQLQQQVLLQQQLQQQQQQQQQQLQHPHQHQPHPQPAAISSGALGFDQDGGPVPRAQTLNSLPSNASISGSLSVQVWMKIFTNHSGPVCNAPSGYYFKVKRILHSRSNFGVIGR